MRREKWPPHWQKGLTDKLEANPLCQKYAAVHPMKEGGRDLDDIRAFAETILSERIPESSDKIISSPV